MSYRQFVVVIELYAMLVGTNSELKFKVSPVVAKLFIRHHPQLLINCAYGPFYYVIYGHGRNASYLAPPAQIPASGTTALGSYLG